MGYKIVHVKYTHTYSHTHGCIEKQTNRKILRGNCFLGLSAFCLFVCFSFYKEQNSYAQCLISMRRKASRRSLGSIWDSILFPGPRGCSPCSAVLAQIPVPVLFFSLVQSLLQSDQQDCWAPLQPAHFSKIHAADVGTFQVYLFPCLDFCTKLGHHTFPASSPVPVLQLLRTFQMESLTGTSFTYHSSARALWHCWGLVEALWVPFKACFLSSGPFHTHPRPVSSLGLVGICVPNPCRLFSGVSSLCLCFWASALSLWLAFLSKSDFSCGSY